RTERGASAAELAETIANTELLPLFLRTAQTIIRQLGTLHAAALQPRKGGRAPQQQFDAGFDEGQRAQGERAREMNDLAVAHVKHTFFGTLYGFLDTLHMLAFKTQPVAEAGMLASLPYSVSSALSPQGAAAEGRRQSFRLAAKQSTEPSKARHSTRSFFLLASLCNLTAFRAYVIPDLLHAHAIRHVFKLEVGGSLQQLGKPFQRLDELVFGFYVGGRSAQLAQIVRRGVLLGGVSWATHAMPRDTQAYVAEALLFLVFTHAEVMDMIGEVGLGAEHHTVKHQPIARRVLEKLAADLLQEMLESVRRVD
ncbi:Exocyst complex component S5, partial [Linderina pennispora]